MAADFAFAVICISEDLMAITESSDPNLIMESSDGALGRKVAIILSTSSL